MLLFLYFFPGSPRALRTSSLGSRVRRITEEQKPKNRAKRIDYLLIVTYSLNGTVRTVQVPVEKKCEVFAKIDFSEHSYSLGRQIVRHEGMELFFAYVVRAVSSAEDLFPPFSKF